MQLRFDFMYFMCKRATSHSWYFILASQHYRSHPSVLFSKNPNFAFIQTEKWRTLNFNHFEFFCQHPIAVNNYSNITAGLEWNVPCGIRTHSHPLRYCILYFLRCKAFQKWRTSYRFCGELSLEGLLTDRGSGMHAWCRCGQWHRKSPNHSGLRRHVRKAHCYTS